MVHAAGTSSAARLALASCVVQYGGPMFDGVSHTRSIATLLEGTTTLPYLFTRASYRSYRRFISLPDNNATVSLTVYSTN